MTLHDLIYPAGKMGPDGGRGRRLRRVSGRPGWSEMLLSGLIAILPMAPLPHDVPGILIQPRVAEVRGLSLLTRPPYNLLPLYCHQEGLPMELCQSPFTLE